MAGSTFFRRAPSRFFRKTAGQFSGTCLAGLLLVAAPAAANPAILFDVSTGNVLADTDAFMRWHPASLTKLMTAYVTFRAIDAGELQLDSPIRMTKHAAGEPPSKMGYKPGSVMSLDNALKMMIIKSANDVTMAIAENVGGTEKSFVDRMNAEARRLGMTDTNFVNPNGLHDPEQYVSARDMALLVTAIRKEYPQYAPYFSIHGLSAGDKKLMNFNMLVGRFPGADGMKTGFVCASGFNLIGTATRGGKTLAVVVLGETSAVGRADKAAALLEHGFGMNSVPTNTLATLPYYGVRGQPPADMRAEVCGRQPSAAQSEAAGDHEARNVKSPWLEKIANPKLFAVGLGNAKGPVPLARRNDAGEEYADVPIPTPRPTDYVPVETKANARARTAASVN